MFNKNKRREKSVYLSMENGEVKDSKFDIHKINARVCDDFSDEELKEEYENVQEFSSNGLPICEPTTNIPIATEEDFKNIKNREEIEDSTVSEMKISLFNIFKFIFVFCIIAIFGFILFKISPMIELNINKEPSKEVIQNADGSTTIINENSENNIKRKEMKLLIANIDNLNNTNKDIKSYYNYLSQNANSYKNDNLTIYSFNKNIEYSESIFNENYLVLLNTEQSEYELENKLIENYIKRYANLTECTKKLKNDKETFRSNAITIVNEFIVKDNQLNQESFDLLIEYFNLHGLSYTITEDTIILND